MLQAESEQVADRRLKSRRGFVIAFAIVALTVSLAARGVHVTLDLKPTVHSDSSYNKVQHRDKDASEGAAPVCTFSLFLLAESLVPSAPSPEPQQRLHFESLYNRPPPAVA